RSSVARHDARPFSTFVLSAEWAWQRHAHDIVGEQLKVMKRISNTPVAVEAVITSSGFVVGPYLTELAGFPELTPYPGGWCGNEMKPDVLNAQQRSQTREPVRQMGEGLRKHGYRGSFDGDSVIDRNSYDASL